MPPPVGTVLTCKNCGNKETFAPPPTQTNVLIADQPILPSDISSTKMFHTPSIANNIWASALWGGFWLLWPVVVSLGTIVLTAHKIIPDLIKSAVREAINEKNSPPKESNE